MNERQLRENLRHLPETRAGDGFTEAVLARLETTGGEHRRALPGSVLRPALAAVALTAVVALALLLTGVPAPPGPPPDDAGTEAPALATAGDAAPAAGRLADAAAGTPLELPPGVRAARAADRGGDGRAAVAPPDATDTAARRRLAELRRERERLRAQLAALEGMPQQEPKLLLAGDETVELVLDFGRYGEGGVRPAGYGPPPSGGGPRYR